MFTLTKKEDKLYVTLSSHNTDNIFILDRTNLDFDIIFNDFGFEFYINIPWEFIGVNPDNEEIIPINIVGLISNPKTSQFLTHCSMFHETDNVWDFRGISAIRFKS